MFGKKHEVEPEDMDAMNAAGAGAHTEVKDAGAEGLAASDGTVADAPSGTTAATGPASGPTVAYGATTPGNSMDAGAHPSDDAASDAGAPEGEGINEDEEAAASDGRHGSVGSFFSEGASAVKEVSSARKAYASARDELKQLDAHIDEQQAELDYRRDVEQRYDQIIVEQRARQAQALKAADEAENTAKGMDANAAAMKNDLRTMREADAATEKRLKNALDAANAKEASARESGTRLQRRLDDAKRNLENARNEKEAGVAAAQKNIDVTSERLQSLRDEYGELQRNPTASSAGYSVRSGELEAQISDVSEELRQARDELSRVTAELDASIDEAQRAVQEAEKPIGEAKRSFDQITAEADAARDALDAGKKDATNRQKELRTKITNEEDSARKQREEADLQREEAENAVAAMDEATDVRNHPEVTEALARALAADRAEREELAGTVEELAAAEKDVRRRTRGSRYKFIGVIVAIVAVVLVIVAVVMLLSMQG